jgi:hypothetical protein
LRQRHLLTDRRTPFPSGSARSLYQHTNATLQPDFNKHSPSMRNIFPIQSIKKNLKGIPIDFSIRYKNMFRKSYWH